MTRDEALTLLEDGKDGIAAWNNWVDGKVGKVEALPPFTPDGPLRINLQVADLSGEDLEGVNLSGAGLVQANFSQARLRVADLSGANLYGANLSGADLVGANLAGADLGGAKLSGANLMHANLKGASLEFSDLSGAYLKSADFSEAQLRDVKGMQLHDTFIRNANFLPAGYFPWQSDSWTQLRESYTGARLFFNLLLLFGFLAPLAAKVLFWLAVQESQSSLEATAIPLRSEVSQLRQELEQDPACLPAVSAADRVEKLVGNPNLTRCLGMECQERSVFSVLLGADGRSGFWLPTFSVLMLIYNICRGAMTRFVSAMRDSEERSGWSPPYDRKFKTLKYCHWLTWVLGQLALTTGIYQICTFLASPISVPW